MRQHQTPQRRRILLTLPVLLLLTNIALGAVLLYRSQTAILTQMEGRMLDTVTTAAALLDGDSLRQADGDILHTPGGAAAFETLCRFAQHSQLRYIYVAAPDPEGVYHILMDASDPIGEDYGAGIQDTAALREAEGGVAGVDQEPYTDEYGTFYSAYAPVTDSEGRTVAVVAADFDVDWYKQQAGGNLLAIFLGCVASVAMGGVTVVLLSRRWERRARRLQEGVRAMSRDVEALTRELSPQEPYIEVPEDEIGTLEQRMDRLQRELHRHIDGLNTQAQRMITALSSDYRSVFYVDFDRNEAVCYQSNPALDDSKQPGERFDYAPALERYAHRYVTEPYREAFLRFVQADRVRQALLRERLISTIYMVERGGQQSYEMFRVAGVRRPEDRDDGTVHAVCAGFTDVDAETRKALSQGQDMQQALMAAQEASRAKTAFLSSMSHEIRTPMNAIIGLDRIALSEPGLSERTRDHLEKIGSSADHLLQIINDILDISRIEAGRMSLKNEPFLCAEVLEQVNTMAEGQCREKGLTYRAEIDEAVRGYYIGDDVKLKQVLINILGNAVKFTPAGGSVTLRAERTAHLDSSTTLRFTVEDTGIGMDKSFLPKLFHAFSQEDETKTNRYGSSGLGMAITRELVDMMQGSISVDSEKGVGTTFTVSLTLRDGGPGAPEDRTALRLQDWNVLVVDDDPISCEQTRLALERAGIPADVAQSGGEAVETARLHLVRQQGYDLILVDWRMPDMDGAETAKALRSAVGQDPAIVILTGYSREEVHCPEADACLTKPLDIAALPEACRSAGKRAGQPVHRATLEGRRVLLAEDMDLNAEIIADVLEMRGIHTEIAENGRVAVEKFNARPVGWFDAILMDMRMPEMDGLEATACIRSGTHPDGPDIPIIALTANAFDEDVQRSIEAGLNAHLTKPVDPEALYETLERLIRG